MTGASFRSKYLWSWWGMAAAILVSGFVLLLWRTSASWTFSTCFLLALIPLAICTLPLWWADGLPPLGVRWLVFAVAWGAFVASCSALLVSHVNLLLILYVFVYHFGQTIEEASKLSHLLTSVVSAPLVEEIAKGSLAILMLWHPWRLITGLWQSIWITALVALGFGFAENAVLAANETLNGSAPWGVFWGRWYLPIVHVGMALPLGAAIGFASRLPTVSQRLGVILVGWLLAVFLHASWNWAGLFYRGEDASFIFSSLFMGSAYIVLSTLVMAVVYRFEKRSLARQITLPQGTNENTTKVLRLAQLTRLAKSLPPDEVESAEKKELESSLYTDATSSPSVG